MLLYICVMDKLKYDNIDKEEIEKALSEVFYNRVGENKSTRAPSIKHYEWEEDGKKYSSWKIDTGSAIINCGDAGMEHLEKAVKKQIKSEINKTK